MQAPDRFARGATTSSLQRQGRNEQLDLGLIKVAPVGSARLMRYAVHEIDLRSFQSADGLSYSLGFDLTALTRSEGRGLLEEVLDRMALGGEGCATIVDADEEQPT